MWVVTNEAITCQKKHKVKSEKHFKTSSTVQTRCVTANLCALYQQKSINSLYNKHVMFKWITCNHKQNYLNVSVKKKQLLNGGVTSLKYIMHKGPSNSANFNKTFTLCCFHFPCKRFQHVFRLINNVCWNYGMQLT